MSKPSSLVKSGDCDKDYMRKCMKELRTVAQKHFVVVVLVINNNNNKNKYLANL